MGVAGPHPPPPVRPEDVADRPVERDRVRHGTDGADLVGAVVVGRVDATQVLRRLDAWLLHGVEAGGGVLPAVQRRPGERRPGIVGDRAADHHAITVVIVDEHRLAARPRRRARHVERPEHGVLGGALGAAVGDELDQRRHPEGVGQEDELLARVVALLAGGGEELDACEPLVALQPDLLDERVQMADGGLADLAQPGVR